jgi:hypothetical protein
VAGDRWLLCSDGVSDYLPDDAIAESCETSRHRARGAALQAGRATTSPPSSQTSTAPSAGAVSSRGGRALQRGRLAGRQRGGAAQRTYMTSGSKRGERTERLGGQPFRTQYSYPPIISRTA